MFYLIRAFPYDHFHFLRQIRRLVSNHSALLMSITMKTEAWKYFRIRLLWSCGSDDITIVYLGRGMVMVRLVEGCSKTLKHGTSHQEHFG